MANSARDYIYSSLSYFCADLKRLQQAAAISQKQLAHATGYSPSWISDFLNGKLRQPPDWPYVSTMVRACLEGAERMGSPVPAGPENEEDWQIRYELRLWRVNALQHRRMNRIKVTCRVMKRICYCVSIFHLRVYTQPRQTGFWRFFATGL
jgi:transcriptional regulator with XRE-family HTH domain